MNKMLAKIPTKGAVPGIFLGLVLWLLIAFYLGYAVVGTVIGLSVALFYIIGDLKK